MTDATITNPFAWQEVRSTLDSCGVALESEEAVRSYLARHADTVDAVGEACRTARQEFGPDASLSLQVYRDVEIADEYLTLYVRLAGYSQDTLRRIKAVSAAIEHHLCDRSGSLLVTTDFRLAGSANGL
jgi:hypothetical protein